MQGTQLDPFPFNHKIHPTFKLKEVRVKKEKERRKKAKLKRRTPPHPIQGLRKDFNLFPVPRPWTPYPGGRRCIWPLIVIGTGPKMSSSAAPKKGATVRIKDKGLTGTIAYIGLTEFAAGKWIGVVLDEPKGKNNGTVQGKEYFKCKDKHGMFVRQTQVDVIDTGGGGGADEDDRPASRASNASSTASKDASPKAAGEQVRQSAVTPTKVASPRSSAIPKPGGGAATGGSRLPMPGKGPTGARSPSFTNLKGAKAQKEGAVGAKAAIGMHKERSFVEKDFRQTVAAPGQSSAASTPSASSATPSTKAASPAKSSPLAMSASTASPALSERMEEKIAAAQAQQELIQAKDNIKDLEEKLETIKIKRAKDQEKLKDLEKLRIQHEQLMEFKSRIMDSQSQLQKEVQKAKHEAREALEAKERHAEEMSELAESVEMITLDKEMAEEKAEALQLELEAAKEKVEELTLDLDIIKAEMGDEGGGSGGKETEGKSVTNFEMKQQVAQNEKLRETLVGLRDLLAHEKNQNMKMVKDLEEKTKAVTDLSDSQEKLQTQKDELDHTIADLQEQVDAALGAEEMVENLTTKCLDMEDKYAALLEEKEDLEKLHELNEELQENAREVELQLQEELDMAQGKIRESTRSRDAAYEIIADHEKTIKNFREHVRQVQEQNADLRAALEKETNKPVAQEAAPQLMAFKAVFEESKAHSRAVEMELRTCEERQARQHVAYLSSYMSESFTRRGGDNEAVLLLLLIPRVIWKTDILKSQVRETLAVPLTDPVDGQALLKGHNVEKHNYGLCLIHHLEALATQLSKFQVKFHTCINKSPYNY